MRNILHLTKSKVLIFEAKARMFQDLGITNFKLKTLMKKRTSSDDIYGIPLSQNWAYAYVSKCDLHLLKLINENANIIYAGCTVKCPLSIKYFKFRGTHVTSLPNSVTIYGNLDLSYTNFRKLPKNLTVHGDVSICGTLIRRLPKTLRIIGNLDVEGSKIPGDYIIPDEAQITGKVSGLNYY